MGKTTGSRVKESVADYYDRRRVLRELREDSIEFSLDEDLRKQILEGSRTRRLQNVSIKVDPVQIQAIKKIAAMKSIPYQTLIRLWIAESIRKELHLELEAGPR